MNDILTIISKNKAKEFLDNILGVEVALPDNLEAIWDVLQFQIPFQTSSYSNLIESKYRYEGVTYVAYWEPQKNQSTPIIIGVLKTKRNPMC
jgi:hypothetical protein